MEPVIAKQGDLACSCQRKVLLADGGKLKCHQRADGSWYYKAPNQKPLKSNSRVLVSHTCRGRSRPTSKEMNSATVRSNKASTTKETLSKSFTTKKATTNAALLPDSDPSMVVTQTTLSKNGGAILKLVEPAVPQARLIHLGQQAMLERGKGTVKYVYSGGTTAIDDRHSWHRTQIAKHGYTHAQMFYAKTTNICAAETKLNQITGQSASNCGEDDGWVYVVIAK
ncbi:hypothetical protein HDV00_000932 [Rhizophlyctis rosea]|nr:hypothetical protein HDV00_000932 [Rhizophlyctis rosea]